MLAALVLLLAFQQAAEAPATDSPRASLTRYLELCREGNYGGAARFLGESAEGERSARRLKAVLDRHVWFDLERISPLSGGDADDGLDPGIDEVGGIPSPTGTPEPVRMQRVESEGEARWVFSTATVAQIDTWFSRLDDRWALEHLPAVLLRPGPGELLWWQWLALPLLGLVGLVGGKLLSGITRALLNRLAARTAATWDDELLKRISGPLTAAWAIGVAALLVPLLALYEPGEATMHHVLRVSLFLVFFWAQLRVLDVIAQVVISTQWSREHPATGSLVPLGRRVGKLLVLAVAAIAVLSELGFPIASLIAGLGIGGLALALAAQKTVENLFGAFSLGMDQPMREGDVVRIEDVVGTVEMVGLRSTRIRTPDRTLISFPNGKLADMRIESLTARDRMRLSCVLGLTYDTSVAQMRQVLAELERVLSDHPLVWRENIQVRFKELSSSSLDIEVMAWFRTSDWGEFLLIRQEMLLQFMEVVEKAGSSFAFPTRTLHLARGSTGPAAGGIAEAR